MKNLKYKVEELHRGKWIPLKNDKDEQKTVHITERTAEIMNSDAVGCRMRYVLVGEIEGAGSVEEGNDAPSMEWTKKELEQYASDNEFDISECKNKTEILAVIEA